MGKRETKDYRLYQKTMMHSEKPLVTIVTITLNLLKAGREKYFRQNLESVHNQTYENIEHIIIDGASTDGTLDLIKEYADKGWVRYISEPDTGLYDAMNKGIKMAEGKYWVPLNSDDFYHNPDAVKMSVEALEKEKADFSYANYLAIDGKNTRIVRGAIEIFPYTMPFGHPTMFTKTSVLRAEGGFNQEYKVAADYDLILQLIFKDCRGVFVDADIVSFRMGGVCCNVDYSDEIARIYMKNYAPFFDFASTDQAKKIMFGMIVPEDFPEKFKKFANRRGIKNIDIEKVAAVLETKAAENADREPISRLPDGIASKIDRYLRNSRLRQPARKIYYAARLKKIK